MVQHEVFTVKKYNDYKYKITYLQCVKISGSENETVVKGDRCCVNSDKLSNNLSRAKSKINEYALCNDWDYFVTFTLDKEKYNRYDLSKFKKDLSEFLHNYNKRCDDLDKVKYILVPEQHNDGAWHMHGLIKGIKKKDIVVNRNGYLTWKQYNDKFGYMSMDKIRDKDKVSSYILKYITKDSAKNVTELNARLYYASKGLNTAELIFRSNTVRKKFNFDWDWEHPDGFVKFKNVDTRHNQISNYLEVEEYGIE